MAALVLEVPGVIPKLNPGELVPPDLKRFADGSSYGYGIGLDKEAKPPARDGKAIKYYCSGIHGDCQSRGPTRSDQVSRVQTEAMAGPPPTHNEASPTVSPERPIS